MLGTATKLQNARQINGTNFDGTGNITTSKWGTSRNLALSGAVSGNANIDGSGNVTINTTQSNVAVLTGNVSLTNGSGSASLNYPSGYTRDNCMVLSAGLNMGSYYEFNHASGTMLIGARLASSNVTFTVSSPEGIGSTGTKAFKIVLMKVS